MKKIICLLIVTALAIVALPAYAFSDLEPDAPYGEAAETLCALGIMEKAGDNSFSPKKTVLRGEFIKYAMAINGVSDNLSEYESVFYDVPLQYQYAREIVTAYKLGFVVGDGSGFFKPDEPITYASAAKILSCVTGRANITGYSDNSSLGYIADMNRLKISSGLSLDMDSSLSRGEAANLLYNTLFAEVSLQTSYAGDNVSYTTDENKTVLTERMGMEFIEGRVTANRRTSLIENGTNPGGNVEIEFLKFKPYEGFDDNLLGMNVKAYYRIVDDTIRQLIYVHASSKNDVKEIEAENIVSSVAGDFVYNRDENDSKNYTVKIPKDIYVIYNNEAYLNWNYADFKPERGRVTLIDNDSDSTIDIVKVTAYENYIVSAVKAATGLIYLKGTLPIDMSGDKDIKIYDTYSGKQLGITNLSSDMLVSVLYGKAGDNITVYAGNKKVSGILSQIGDKEITIGGQTYKALKEFDVRGYLGSNITVYLDCMEKAAAIDDDSTVSENTGFIIAAGNTKGINSEPMVKILLSDGDKRDYKFSDKITVDGSTKCGSAAITKDNILEILKNASVSYGRDDTVLQLINYKTNSSGEIYEIDTANYNEEIEGDSSLQLSKRVTTADDRLYCRSNGVMSGEFNVSSSAKVFLVTDITGKTNVDSDDIGVKSGTYFELDNYYPLAGIHTAMEFYNFNDVKTTDTVVVYLNDGSSASSIGEIQGNYRNKIMVINSILEVAEDNGDHSYEIKGAGVAGECGFIVAQTLLNKVKIENDLAPGDVIAYELLDNGKMFNYKKMFDYDKDAPFTQGVYTAQNASFYGEVLSSDGEYIAVNFGSAKAPLIKTFTTLPTYVKIYVYNTNKRTVRVSDVDSFVGSLDSGGAGDIVYIYTNWSTPYLIVIYE